MTRPKKAISAQINAASVAVANAAADPEISTAMGGVGFGPQRLAIGRGLIEAASFAVSAQVAAAGAYRAASATADSFEKVSRSGVSSFGQVAAVALGDDRAALTTLGLDRPMPRAIAPFLTAVLAVYDNALGNPGLLEKLSAFGYNQERLTAERGRVLELIEARRAQEMAKGAAQQATAKQGQAMTALAREMRDFRRIARVALKDRPQLLEKLGIMARSTRTAAQRGAGKKAAATRAAKKGAAGGE